MGVISWVLNNQEELSGILKSGAISVAITFLACHNLKLNIVPTVSFTFLAVFLDLVWGIILDIPNDVFGIDWWEHYDWGLLCISLSQLTSLYFLLGSGIHLVISECFQENPFSYGEKSFLKTTVVGVLMSIFTVASVILNYYSLFNVAYKV